VLGGFFNRVYRATEDLNKESILGLIAPRPGGALLDCGCGDGAFTRALADRAAVAAAHGVETVEERARVAEGRGIVVARVDLNERLPFPDGFFDIVHANQLLEHLHGTDDFLREIRRLVKPGGYALVSTNNLASWHNVVSLVLGMQPTPMHVSSEVIVGNRLDPYRGFRFGSREDSHLRIFSFQGLKELCEHHGFRVEVLKSAGYYPFPPGLARPLAALDRRHGVFLIARLGAAA
jgi:methionine biosynthesis protein MetW